MKKLAYYLLKGVVYLLSLLPFWALYALADGCYVVVCHLVRYRRKVVRSNLASSFPEKSADELKQVERRFYHWLCDYAVETIKLLSISDKALLRRMEFRGVEQLEQVFDEGRDCALILGHYCNWEWLSVMKRTFKRHPDAELGAIYHPLYNEAFDRLFIDIRSVHGSLCVAKQDILRELVRLNREKRRSAFCYISDQSPRWKDIHLFLPFLNHDTPVFTGGERIMRKKDNVVFYLDMERPRRGCYTCTVRLVSNHAAQEPENAIIVRFFQLLEQTIRRDPAYYLWTHKRWKRTKEEFDQKYMLVNGRTIPKEQGVYGS